LDGENDIKEEKKVETEGKKGWNEERGVFAYVCRALDTVGIVL
jgi:hypothetical protein